MNSLPPVPRGAVGTVVNGHVTLDPVFSRWLDGFRNIFNVTANGNIPTGAVMPTFGAVDIPGLWLLLNGQSVSKRDYAALYEVIGDTFGATADTFTLPDLTDRTVMGAGAVALAALAGSSSVTLTIGQLPSHGHAITDPGHVHTGFVASAALAATGLDVPTPVAGNTGSATTGITVGNTGSGNAIDITPPVIGVNWLIKT